MFNSLNRKKENGLVEIAEKEFDYKIYQMIIQGVGCRYKKNYECTVTNPCPFENSKCNYNRFRLVLLREKIEELKENNNKNMRNYIENELIWLKNLKLMEAVIYYEQKLEKIKTKGLKRVLNSD